MWVTNRYESRQATYHDEPEYERDKMHDWVIKKASNAALQRPGDNFAKDKLSMRSMLIPVRCKRLFGLLTSSPSLFL
jgi:hypothetical protein